MGHHGGRADIDGQAVEPLGVARPHVDHLALAPYHGGDPLLASAKRRGELAQGGQVDLQAVQTPLASQGCLKAFPIPQPLTKRVRFHLDKALAQGRVKRHWPLGRALADNLAVGLALGRHRDQQVALETGRAREPRTELVGRGMARKIIGLSRLGRAQVRGARLDRVLGEAALLDNHLTLAAGLPPPADAIDIDAELARGAEQRSASGDAALATGGLKDYQVVGHSGCWV